MKLKKNHLLKTIATVSILLLLIASPLFLNAQTDVSDNSDKPKELPRKWIITVNGGATLLWGDLTQEYDNPLTKYFSDQQGWAGGLMISRKLGNSFTANLQYMGGFFQGHKDFWSNGDTADASFNSNFHDINLNFEVDILNLFNNKERRMIAPYIKLGVGYGFSTSSRGKYSTGENTITDVKTSYLDIPWGWGLRFDLTKNLSLRFEHTFHMVMNDLADGYAAPTSDVNDIFSYTSLGLSYKLPRHEKKAKMPKEEDIEETDSAIVLVEDEPKFELGIQASIPNSMETTDTALVTLIINKGDISGKAKIQQTIPESITISPLTSNGATYSFTNQVLTYEWDNLPSDEKITITYKMLTNKAEIKTVIISGIMYYLQDDTNQIRQFNKRINIVEPAVIAVVDKKPDVKPTPTPTPVPQKKGDLIYRVQVYAVYGGTTSASLLQKRLKLKYGVHQDYQGKYAKYTSGEFSTYEEAAAYKNELRNSTVPGAFVVGFYDGNRTDNIQQAIAIEKGNEPVSKKVAKGIIYRIQILASSKNLSIQQVKDITGTSYQFVKTSHNGLYKYEVGNYKSYSEAKAELQKIRNEVSDAFLIKYVDGKR